MDMDMGAMDPEVMNLPLTDPRCIRAAEGCIAFWAAENNSQDAIPWASQFEYGHYLTYYWVVAIGLLSIAYWSQLVYARRQRVARLSTTAELPSLWQKAQARFRTLAYRRFSGPLILHLPSHGMVAFLLVGIVFVVALALAVRPYYREHLGYGSPPLAIRTGLMAFACVPLLVALSGKANAITFLTGISHEKLNVVHRWVAWVSFGLSLAHTIPFFVASYQDWGFGGYERVHIEFYRDLGAGYEFSGTAPLAMLFGLCVLSLRPLRNRFYESFYAVHILLAVTYLGLLFWHAGDYIDSWAYLWATLAVWLSSWFARLFWFTRPLNVRGHWFAASRATLDVLAPDLTRITVWPPRDFVWRPGQHVFLRFVDFAPLENHPFTIASACVTGTPGAGGQPNAGNDRELVFLARAHDGLTRRLVAYASRSAAETGVARGPVAANAWVDGPYGGIRLPIERTYDSLLLVAGGTGITACLPWIEHLVKNDPSAFRVRRIKLVWAVRSPLWISWFSDSLRALSLLAKSASDPVDLSFDFHVTGPDGTAAPAQTIVGDVADGEEKGTIADTVKEDTEAVAGRDITELGGVAPARPVMSELISNFVRSKERAVVVGCGPETFRIDLANAVAAAQARVLRGECLELALHLETFGW